MESREKYKVIGLMSGTSLDGVDIACCIFKRYEGSWAWAIEHAQTVKYSASWKRKLREAHTLSGEQLLALHAEYGKFLGLLVHAFVNTNKIRGVDFVASHGHTIFHQPDRCFTFQLGNGAVLHAACGLPVVSDFRSMDVAFGGQGAPLVPIGDKFLFNDYDACLNLGGIANISLEDKRDRRAFDICFVNMGLNLLAQQDSVEYDKRGTLASRGEINTRLLQQLTKAYDKVRSKRPSLAREFFQSTFQPLLENTTISLHDRLRTFSESIALEIKQAIPLKKKKTTVLCTGGGAFNAFLVYRIMDVCGDDVDLVLPDDDIINYKEALIFAFLGVLKIEGKTNTLRSATGARKDTIGGVVIG